MRLLEKNNVVITFATNVELAEAVKLMDIDNQTKSVDVYRGFSYLSPIDFTFEGSEYNTKFICAYYQNELIGVMKLKRYHRKTHETVLEVDKENTDNYLAIRFVDVREDMRR